MRTHQQTNRFGFKVILLIWGLGICFAHHFPEAGQKEVTVIQNVRIFDGGNAIPDSTVHISSGKIQRIGKNIPIPQGSEVIDGTGHTLLPGLFDCHIHVWSAQNLEQSLAFGVTTVVDMFTDVKTMIELKKAQKTDRAFSRAYLLSPGILATAPGGHGTQYGLAIPTLTGPGDADAFVEDRISEGSDFIKIILEDGSAFGMSRPTLDIETIAAVVKAAHSRDKLAIIHAATLKNCLGAIDVGVDGLAHLFFNNAYDPEFGRRASQSGTFVIPTLAVLEEIQSRSGGVPILKETRFIPYLTPQDHQMLEMEFPFKTEKGAYQAAETALKQLIAESVPILAGTDAPNPGTTYGASLHRELELLVEAGLSPQEALIAATSVPARIFGLTDRGGISEGFMADLLLVKGDPTRNILDTRNIAGVWRAGRRFDRAHYLENIEKEKAKLEQLKSAPPPEYSESGWISDFEGEEITSRFGVGWSLSTDRMAGGKSDAQFQLTEGGALNSNGSLLITGTVAESSPYPWAGAFYSPGKSMMSPTNLSFKDSISFWAKGDGKTYSIMVFAQSLGFTPSSLTFKPGAEWQEYSFAFKQFSVEGFDIMGIFIGGATEPGDFRLQIDNVRLVNKK